MARLGKLLCILVSLIVFTSAEITLRFHYPDSSLSSSDRLFIRGDAFGLNWNSGWVLNHNSADLWTFQFNSNQQPTNGRCEFKALVNDQVWQIGSNEAVIYDGSSVTFDFYPFFKSSQGQYAVFEGFRSDALQNTRDMVVYVPASYFENTLKSYELLVMHDGQNLFNDSTSAFGTSWHCAETINSLVIDGEMSEIIVAGPYNTPNRIEEYTYSKDPQYGGGEGNLYLDFLEQVIVPYMRDNFRIRPGRVGMMGSSLGGLISCYAGWTRSSVYDTVGCMSSSFWWNNQDFNNTVLQSATIPEPSTQFYLDSGNAGPDNDDMLQTQGVLAHLKRRDLQDLFYYLDQGGQHSEKYWGARFHVPMTDLYAPKVTQPTTD